MRGRVPSVVALLCLGAWIATPIGQEPAPLAGAVDGEILVKFNAQAPASRRDAALAAAGGQRIKRFAAVDLDHVRLPRGRRVADAIAGLLASGTVIAAQPNYIRRIAATPPPNDFLWVNDTANGFYGLKKIQADLVWAAPHNNTGSSAVIVADIDTGVQYTHPDLAANMWTNPGEIAGNGSMTMGMGTWMMCTASTPSPIAGIRWTITGTARTPPAPLARSATTAPTTSPAPRPSA